MKQAQALFEHEEIVPCIASHSIKMMKLNPEDSTGVWRFNCGSDVWDGLAPIFKSHVLVYKPNFVSYTVNSVGERYSLLGVPCLSGV